MKKILICLMALLTLVACNKPVTQDDATVAEGEAAQSEMPVASSEDEGQDEWMKQTTIMSSKPMVIDFYADWCGPCKMLAPVLDEIEKKHQGNVIFKRINVDEEVELAQEFKVEAIPTLMFVTPRGEYVTMMGYHEAPDIEAKIAALLVRSAK